MSEPEQAPPAAVACLKTEASAYAEARLAKLREQLRLIDPFDRITRERIIEAELGRAWLSGSVYGFETARDVLQGKS